ncbi:hypothetical protein TanjilG_10993 [Lupinus angustifolius]|uniref:Glycosyltransferase n=1 Tax=Lupinus angustifolius TaxID=3871 RepID=A0A1J7GAT1_LUPAN|nr:PREDICTED: crocetin glucosyltransferase, chloroplastic-like [Lupinus angustifolius]OIV97469.1 hypothetical protein TanjilG_10993 [Lupinus angustifolius]
MAHQRFLLITYPAQGHINPSLQFAKRLITLGVHVTFATTIHMQRCINKNKTIIPGLSITAFSDGYDDGFNSAADVDVLSYISELKHRGSECLTNVIAYAIQQGNPFTCITYTLLLPWVATVAREFQLPSALLWIQPATVFDMYYFYFHGYEEYMIQNVKEPTCSLELPGLPFIFKPRDLPSFFWPSNMYSFALPSFKEQLEVLDLETNPIVLVNTFEELEHEALRAIEDIRMIPIGPLIPSAFLDGKDPNDTSFGGDIIHGTNDYVTWLDSKPKLSVVYVSFGSLAVLPKRQMEEIAIALLDSKHPFLWVIRENNAKEVLKYRDELEQGGKIVKWCSQVEVLSHHSLGCFVTHCGWNSTMESLVCGVPVVAFPQWTDQTTNAKLIEDVWKSGVRVDHELNEDGIVERDEIRKCLEVVMGSGEKGQELRRNSYKWKDLAKEAVKEGGSSDKNLRTFLDVVGNGK